MRSALLMYVLVVAWYPVGVNWWICRYGTGTEKNSPDGTFLRTLTRVGCLVFHNLCRIYAVLDRSGLYSKRFRKKMIVEGITNDWIEIFRIREVDATRRAQYATITCAFGSFRSQSFPSIYLHNAPIDMFQSGDVYSKNCDSKIPPWQQIPSRVQRSGFFWWW
jgi:hypothetical protein